MSRAHFLFDGKRLVIQHIITDPTTGVQRVRNIESRLSENELVHLFHHDVLRSHLDNCTWEQVFQRIHQLSKHKTLACEIHRKQKKKCPENCPYRSR